MACCIMFCAQAVNFSTTLGHAASLTCLATPASSSSACSVYVPAPLRSSPLLVSSSSPTAARIVGSAPPPGAHHPTNTLRRRDFPSDFLFGTGSSAFQMEGAPTAGGRAQTIWDSFTHLPGRILDGDLNFPGCDFYHRYEEDIKIMKELGFQAFRFSISWTRIYPDANGPPSGEGIRFYNNLINAIVRAGLTPVVTLFHWETPQYLENDPNVLGWRTKSIVPHFEKLARTCFQNFGDRVKIWATINEMVIFSTMGYAYGTSAPGRCTPSLVGNKNCMAGDSRTEPYLVGHHLLLAHAKVYHLYKNMYKDHQGGECGFNPAHSGAEPYSDSKEDALATERLLEFYTGWQVDPLVFGDYPKSMRDVLGERLPTFTNEERDEVKDSFDFIGHNYYTARYVKHADLPKDPQERWYMNDGGYTQHETNVDGKLIGTHMGPSRSWIYNCPSHLPKLLVWMKNRYGNLPCYITENGVIDNEPDDVEKCINDKERLTYIQDHLTHLSKAIKKHHLKVKGYFCWSFIDNFEWSNGFFLRFGIVHVRFEDGKEPIRTLKKSAKWFQKFLN